MSSADPGAPSRAPGRRRALARRTRLEPVERADRDGIASWDLVLDGRRRFDLRVTVILDPALALICWAHYAPPISDMFRKSYRRLLRWNDEFPFAKFSVGEDERPLLAVEMPVEDAGRRRARAGASPGSSASPTGCSTNRRTGCGSAAGCPTRATGSRANEAFLDRYAGAAARAAGAGRRPGHEHRRPEIAWPSIGLRVSRRSRSCPRSSSRRPGCSRRPLGSAEVRAATPDLTIVGNARYDVQPAAAARPGHGRPRADEPPQRHEDQALLLRPRVPGGPARRVRVQADLGRQPATPRVDRLEEDVDLHAPAAQSRAAAVQRQDRDYRLGFDLVDPGGAADARRAGRRLARLVPGLGVRHRLDPGQLGQGRLPGRLRGRRRGRRDPGADDRRRRARRSSRRGKLAKPLDVLRLPRRRPAGRLRRADRRRRRSTVRRSS